MRKKNHHFVPQFYLRRFGASERAINMFHIASQKFIRGASIRNQCARPDFYGGTEHLENAFMELEDKSSVTLARVVNERSLPQRDSEEYVLLLTFLAFQKQRTLAARELGEQLQEGLQRAVVEEDSSPEASADWRRRLRVDAMKTLAISLSVAPDAARMLSDLEPRLLLSDGPSAYVTSDNPVRHYNQYSEKVRTWGTLGAASIGLQVFFPLAPDVLLLLYDRGVYHDVRKHRGAIVRASSRDVEQMNLLQAIGAHQNYFLPPSQTERDACQLATASAPHRARLGWQFNKGDEVPAAGRDEQGTSVLIHMFERGPDIGMNLGFLALQRGPSREDPLARGYGVRPLAARVIPPAPPGGPTGERTWRTRQQPDEI